jgi:hypothetical protein
MMRRGRKRTANAGSKKSVAGPKLTPGQSFGCGTGGGFTGVTTCGGSGVTARSVVLASRLVHADIATSMASERICVDPRTLLRFPIGLCLQILDRRFSLVPSQLLLKAFAGLIEAGIAVKLLGAA